MASRTLFYVNVPSITDKSAAPEGSDSLYILVPLAPGIRDTNELREKFYNHIMDDMEHKLGDNIRKDVVVQKIFANDFKDR